MAVQQKKVVFNMTEGPLASSILRFMLPLLLGNLVQQAYNMADAMIVGRILGSEALAAVGVSTSVQFMILGLCTGICTGFGVPIAQTFGADDLRQMRRYIWHAIFLAGAVALIGTSLAAGFCHRILALIQTPENIYPSAYGYLLVIFLGIPFSILYNLSAAVLRAVGNSKMPFIFLAVSVVLNVFLDLFCIAVLGWGCVGAAAATITSQALSGMLCVIYILKKVTIIHPGKEDRGFDRHYAAGLLGVGIPMGFQFSITAIGSTVMQAYNNTLGSIFVSGYTAGTKVKQFVLTPFDALGAAAATFAGQNYGARKMDRARKGIGIAMLISTIYGICVSTILVLFSRPIGAMFMQSGASAELDAASRYLHTIGFFICLPGLLIMTRMAIQGLGFSALAFMAGLFEMVGRITVCTIFTSRVGFTAICFADQGAWILGFTYLMITIAVLMRTKLKNPEPDDDRNIGEMV